MISMSRGKRLASYLNMFEKLARRNFLRFQRENVRIIPTLKYVMFLR